MLLSITELKVKLVNWLLSNATVCEAFVSHLTDDHSFMNMLSEATERAADEAIDRYECGRDDEVDADDIKNLDRFVQSEVQSELEDFERNFEPHANNIRDLDDKMEELLSDVDDDVVEALMDRMDVLRKKREAASAPATVTA